MNVQAWVWKTDRVHVGTGRKRVYLDVGNVTLTFESLKHLFEFAIEVKHDVLEVAKRKGNHDGV